MRANDRALLVFKNGSGMTMTTGTTSFKELLLALPDLADYPDMIGTIKRREAAQAVPCWEYPTLACEAVGADPRLARPGVAAIFCLFNSVLLVDDVLDEDARGDYRRLGVGRAANMALAFQAAAFRVIEEADVEEDCRARIQGRLARIALETAVGQDMDAMELDGEEDYWRVVERKTPPLFGGALYVGATLARSPSSVARGLDEFGGLVAKIIQVSDDLKDAMSETPSPDWRRQNNNLAILYATIADHPDKERFLELLSSIEEPGSLPEAQDLLVKSGATSFCMYKMLELYQSAREALGKIALSSIRPLEDLLEQCVKPARDLLQSIGLPAR